MRCKLGSHHPAVGMAHDSRPLDPQPRHQFFVEEDQVPAIVQFLQANGVSDARVSRSIDVEVFGQGVDEWGPPREPMLPVQVEQVGPRSPFHELNLELASPQGERCFSEFDQVSSPKSFSLPWEPRRVSTQLAATTGRRTR